MIQPLKTAIIGYGMSAKVFHGPLLNCLDEFEVIAIHERFKSDSASDFPQAKLRRNYQDVLEDPQVDLVVITTPNQYHYTQAKAALLAGKHVVVEKPFTATSAQALELVALARQVNRAMSVFHNRRWDSDFLWLKALVDSGVRIYEIDSRFDRFRNYLKGWKEQEGDGSGILYDLGSHLIDQVLTLFGTDLELCYVDLQKQRKVAEVTDYFEIHFKYKGTKIILKAGMMCSHSHRLKVDTEQGTFIKNCPDVQEGILKEKVMSFTKADISQESLTHYTSDGQGRELSMPKGDYLNFYEQLFEHIRGGKKNPVTGEEALNVMTWLERIGQKDFKLQ